MQKVRFDKGETIFSEGEPSVHCYKILEGKVEIFLNDPAGPGPAHVRSVGVCGPGEIIGEMGVLGKAPRSASAVAIAPTVCKRFTSHEIISLLEEEPGEAIAYIRTLIERIRSSNNRAFLPSSRKG